MTRIERILRVLTRPNVGGPMRQAVALWHAHRARGVSTLLVVGTCEAGEAAIDTAATGIPRVGCDDVAGAAHGGLLVLDELRRGMAPWRDRAATRRLRAAIAAWQPDVVHTHTTKAGWLGRRAAWRERVPLVAHTYHGHVLSDYFPALVARGMRRVERSFAKRTHALFAVSESCRDELRALGIPGAIAVHRPAVDARAFTAGAREAARARLGLSAGRPLLGFVGRLVPIKRPAWFVDVVERLPGVDGVVFGNGPLRAALEQRAGPRIRFRGVVEDIASELPAIDLLVMPSVREGFPVAGVEAAAAGIPTAGFDVPGVRDLLAASGSPFSAPADGGPDALHHVVRDAIAQGCPRLGARAAELVASCEPARVAAELSACYERVAVAAGRGG